jgi:hypothetical protein
VPQSIKITFARHFNDVVSTEAIGKQNVEEEDLIQLGELL